MLRCRLRARLTNSEPLESTSPYTSTFSKAPSPPPPPKLSSFSSSPPLVYAPYFVPSSSNRVAVSLHAALLRHRLKASHLSQILHTGTPLRLKAGRLQVNHEVTNTRLHVHTLSLDTYTLYLLPRRPNQHCG